MDRQKLLLGVLSGVITFSIILFIFNNRQKDELQMTTVPVQMTETKPVPETPEAIAAEIENQAALDAEALDAELDAETSSIIEESENLNNLSESYDETSI